MKNRKFKPRYKFYKSDNKVFCVSTYAKKAVRGVAKCSPHDEYDEEKGMKLAQLRCDVKVAERRVNRAKTIENATWDNLCDANEAYSEAASYYDNAVERLVEARKNLEDFEKSC